MYFYHKKPDSGGGSPALPAFQSFAETAMSSDGTTIAVNKPAGTVDDELLIAVISMGDAGTVTTALLAGWTALLHDEISGTASFQNSLSVFYKFASSEPSSYTFTMSGTTRGAAHIIRIDQADETTPLTSGTVNTSVDSVIVAPSVTTTLDNSLVLTILSTTNTTRSATASPTTPTLITDTDPASNSTCGWVATYKLDVASAGATSAEQRTLNGGNGNVGVQIIVEPKLI